jgi:electron transfer flavoprotein beta subunit
MNILVLIKMVPDTVEELRVGADGKTLDTEYLRMIVNERDEHALEEALLLKERHGGIVTVLALEQPEVDDVLYTVLAKGADRAIKICNGETGLSTRGAARLFAHVLSTTSGLLPADVILTGVQAIDDLDGQLAPLLAHALGLPYIGIVSKVTVDTAQGIATVMKEYAGGVRAEFDVSLPAVLGIQTAEKPPRYVPVAKVRAVMKSQKIESIAAPAMTAPALVQIMQMVRPEVIGRATMLEGSPEEIAGRICEILVERSIV